MIRIKLTTSKPRDYAVNACIEVTLELLSNSLSQKLKKIISWTGIGTSIQIAVLDILWNISEQESEETVDALWAYGLIEFTHISIPPNNVIQNHVEVHAIISQYIIEHMDSNEMIPLHPNNLNILSVVQKLQSTFQQSYGVHDTTELTVVEFLKYKLSEIENMEIPSYLKLINMHVTNDPHAIMATLQNITFFLRSSPHTVNFFPSLDKEINSLTNDCKEVLHNTHNVCRKLRQRVQRYILEENYDELIQTIENFVKNYSMFSVAQKGVAMVEEIKQHCDADLLWSVVVLCQSLYVCTSDYHVFTTNILPTIKHYIKLQREITHSLRSGTPDIERIYDYYWSGNFAEDLCSMRHDQFNKLGEVIAPNIIKLIDPELLQHK